MSLDTARRLALGAQGFADKPPRGSVDRRHLNGVVGSLRVLQLDSIPAVVRTQYLPFHTRLGPYRLGLLDEVAYRDDRWFEAWAHEASLLPVSSEPLFRWMKARVRDGKTRRGLHTFARRESVYVQRVLDEVRAQGSVTAAQLSDPRRPGNGGSSEGNGWGQRSQGAWALEWLYLAGELGIRRRGNFEKHYSPLDQIVDAAVLSSPTPSAQEACRALVLQAVEALGVGTATDIADYFRLPMREVRAALAELVEGEDVVAASVSGWTHPAFADPRARVPRRLRGATVLSPFDPMVWCRPRAQRLFGFEYKIEIYVPEAKRRWGYYVLPVMVDGQIVARADVKAERDTGVLRVKAAYAEAGHEPRSTARRTMDALRDLARLVQAERLVVEQRGDLARALRRAL